MSDYPKPQAKKATGTARNLLFTSTFALTLMGFILIYFREFLAG